MLKLSRLHPPFSPNFPFPLTSSSFSELDLVVIDKWSSLCTYHLQQKLVLPQPNHDANGGSPRGKGVPG